MHSKKCGPHRSRFWIKDESLYSKPSRTALALNNAKNAHSCSSQQNLLAYCLLPGPKIAEMSAASISERCIASAVSTSSGESCCHRVKPTADLSSASLKVFETLVSFINYLPL